MTVNIRYKIYSVQTRIEGDNGGSLCAYCEALTLEEVSLPVGIMLSYSAVTRMNVLQWAVSSRAQRPSEVSRSTSHSWASSVRIVRRCPVAGQLSLEVSREDPSLFMGARGVALLRVR